MDTSPESEPTEFNHDKEAITRLSQLGFEAKKWCAVAVTAGTIGSSLTTSGAAVLGAIPAIVLFLYVDVYYLAAERSFRAMSTGSGRRSDRRVTFKSMVKALGSLAVWPFYLIAVTSLALTTWLR